MRRQRTATAGRPKNSALVPVSVASWMVRALLPNGEELVSFVYRLNLDTLEMEDCRCSIHEGDLECVKDVFNNGNLRSLSATEFLLMILWIRENLFMMDSLQNDDRLDFIKSAFALTGAFNGIDIDEEKVVCEFLELDREG